MRWIPRLRMLLARRPWIYWAVVAAVAVALATSVAGAVASVDRERNSWGESAQVYVATSRIEVGALIEPSVERREVPLAIVPIAALRALPPETVAVQRISAGEVIVDIDVADSGGPLALLPIGWLAITIEWSIEGSLTAGDSVAILADGAMVAPDAVIVAVVAGAVVIGVPEAVAPAVANAVVQRIAVIALADR